ncbi:hypothetical protein FQZ97_728910 [compost metagenome]
MRAASLKPLAPPCSAFWWLPMMCARPRAGRLSRSSCTSSSAVPARYSPRWRREVSAMSRSMPSVSRRGGSKRMCCFTRRTSAAIVARSTYLSGTHSNRSASAHVKSTISRQKTTPAMASCVLWCPGSNTAACSKTCRKPGSTSAVTNPKSSQPTRMPFPIWSRSMPKGKRARGRSSGSFRESSASA